MRGVNSQGSDPQVTREDHVKAKMFEVRYGEGIHPVLALEMADDVSENRRWLLHHAGFDDPPGIYKIMLVFLDAHECQSDPGQWNVQWKRAAHQWVRDLFYQLDDGAVVDLDFLTGHRTDQRRPAKYNV